MKVVRTIVMFLLVPVIYVFFTLKSLGRTKKYRGRPEPGLWYELRPEGLVNSRGKPSPFFFRKGGGDNLMIYFCGGGVSWSEESAGRPMSILRMMLSITSYYAPVAYRFVRTLFNGILSQKPENPFADWNMVFIPYVTGDFHLGNNDFKYRGGRRTLHHVGENNTRIIMEECKKLFPGAAKLLICGESAGAFGAAGNAPLVARYYPDAKVTVYSDASQLVSPVWQKAAREVWRVNGMLLAKIEEDGKECAAEGVSGNAAENIDESEDLYFKLVEYSACELGGRVVFLRSNTIRDVVLIEFGSTLQGGPHKATPEATKFFTDSLAATEKRLADSGLPYYAFITAHNENPKTGLTQHTMCHDEKSFHISGDAGISLSGWLSDAVNCKYVSIRDY